MLYYSTKGNGTPIILIHGFPNNHTSWDETADFLSEKYKVITPDLPGAGESLAFPNNDNSLSMPQKK